MGVSEPAFKQKKDSSEESRLSKELFAQLSRHGLIREQDGKRFVDISAMNKEYAEYFSVASRGNLATYDNFLEAYKKYRGQSDRRTPDAFVRKAYGKRDFTEAKITTGLGTEIPIKVEPTVDVESPRATATVNLKKTEIGQDILTVKVGTATDSSLDSEPYVKTEYKGFFAESVDKFKEVMVGIQFGLISIGKTIGEAASTVASAILGPWATTYNFVTDATKFVFSPILYAVGMLGKIFERAFSTDEGKLRMTTKGKTEDITDKSIFSGTDRNGAPVQLRVASVDKGFFNTTVTDTNGKEYNVEAPYEGILKFYEREGFWRKFSMVMSPTQLAKDTWDVTVIGPYKTFVNASDGFRDSERRKLTGREKSEYAANLDDALRRKNYETARRIAKTLVENGNSSGSERAAYMLKLDEAQWGIAHTGFFIGYINGMGFGRKKPMAEKELEARINSYLDVLKDKRAKGEYDDTYREAATYMLEKAKYRKTLTGKLVPISPSTPALATAILKEKDEIEKGQKTTVSRYHSVFVGKVDIRSVPATGIQVEKGKEKEAAQAWKNMMKLLDMGYAQADKANDERTKKDIRRYYLLFTDPISAKNNRTIFYNTFSAKLKKRDIDISKIDVDRLDEKKALEYYSAMTRAEAKKA